MKKARQRARNQAKPRLPGIRCKDCRHGTSGPEGIRCEQHGGLYPLHPEFFCLDAEEKR